MEFQNEQDARKALETKVFTYSVREHGRKKDVNLTVHVSPHKTKNTSRGIINCFDLRDTPDEEIVEGLSSFGVIEVRRIKGRRNGQITQTNNIILTFDRTDLPTEVFVGYLRVKVRPYSRSKKYLPSPPRGATVAFRLLAESPPRRAGGLGRR